MKIFMKVLICVTLISVLFSTVSFESSCRMLESDVLRLHILANSDADYDQKLKIRVRDAILEKVSPLFDDVKTKEQAKSIVVENIDRIRTIASEVIKRYGYNYCVDVSIRKEFFDTRYYDDFTMPAGVYDTLLITIGEGSGKNWWCVVYPSLCVGASSQQSMKDSLSDDEYSVITTEKYEFRFRIVEFFKKINLYFY